MHRKWEEIKREIFFFFNRSFFSFQPNKCQAHAHVHPSALTENTTPSADPNCTLQVTGSVCMLQFKAKVGVE